MDQTELSGSVLQKIDFTAIFTVALLNLDNHKNNGDINQMKQNELPKDEHDQSYPPIKFL